MDIHILTRQALKIHPAMTKGTVTLAKFGLTIGILGLTVVVAGSIVGLLIVADES